MVFAQKCQKKWQKRQLWWKLFSRNNKSLKVLSCLAFAWVSRAKSATWIGVCGTSVQNRRVSWHLQLGLHRSNAESTSSSAAGPTTITWTEIPEECYTAFYKRTQLPWVWTPAKHRFSGEAGTHARAGDVYWTVTDAAAIGNRLLSTRYQFPLGIQFVHVQTLHNSSKAFVRASPVAFFTPFPFARQTSPQWILSGRRGASTRKPLTFNDMTTGHTEHLYRRSEVSTHEKVSSLPNLHHF